MHRSTNHVGKPLTTVPLSSAVDLIMVYVSEQSSFTNIPLITYAAAINVYGEVVVSTHSSFLFFPCESANIPLMFCIHNKQTSYFN